jgi:N4-gp56 family major capsid protein
MTNTTTTSLNNFYQSYMVGKALVTLYAETPLYDQAEKTPLPTGNGKQVIWNAWRPLANPSVTLAEGGSPAAEQASGRRVTATVQQVAKAVTYTDLTEYISSLSVREGVNKLLAESAKITLEFTCQMGIFKNTFRGGYAASAVLSAVMSATASGMCANTGTSSLTNRQFQFPVVFANSGTTLSLVSKTAPTRSAVFSLYSIRKATRALRVKNAKPFANGKFRGYTHPNALHILKADPAYQAYTQPQYAEKTMMNGYVTSTDGVDWSSSTLCPRYAATAHSVNLSFIWGQGAFGVTEALGGLEMYIISGVDSGNLVNTLSTFSYKYTGIAAALNPSAGVILASHELL